MLVFVLVFVLVLVIVLVFVLVLVIVLAAVAAQNLPLLSSTLKIKIYNLRKNGRY